MAAPTFPITVQEARAGLTGTVKRFRSEGAGSEPVVFGSHRKPEAALLPYETYEMLLELAEDAAIAARVRERRESDTGERLTLEQSAQELGIDLSDL